MTGKTRGGTKKKTRRDRSVRSSVGRWMRRSDGWSVCHEVASEKKGARVLTSERGVHSRREGIQFSTKQKRQIKRRGDSRLNHQSIYVSIYILYTRVYTILYI